MYYFVNYLLDIVKQKSAENKPITNHKRIFPQRMEDNNNLFFIMTEKENQKTF